MFPFNQRGLVSFQVNNKEDDLHHHQEVELEQDVKASTTTPLHYQAQIDHNNSFSMRNFQNQNTRKGRHRKSKNNMEEDECNQEDVASKKRIMHREIERQRRQEMANLHSSLRSLLPLEYIKGKRSICDHIGETTKYIKDLESNIKELGDKRDNIKFKESSSSVEIRDSNSSCTSSSPSSRSDCSVSIHTFSSSSIDIEISVGVGDGDADAFPLSRVLSVLIEEGLSVVNCLASKVNQRWIYEIHCEVSDETSIDTNQLQWRIMSEIRSYDS